MEQQTQLFLSISLSDGKQMFGFIVLASDIHHSIPAVKALLFNTTNVRIVWTEFLIDKHDSWNTMHTIHEACYLNFVGN